MNADEIKAAIEAGKKVFWSNDGYEVIKDKLGQFMIKCIHNGHCIGLTWTDGKTLNGKPEEFFILENGRVMPENLYSALVEAKIQIDHHESDLRFPTTEQSSAILAKFPLEQHNATQFRNQIDGKIWYDVPFAYIPFWKAKQRLGKS